MITATLEHILGIMAGVLTILVIIGGIALKWLTLWIDKRINGKLERIEKGLEKVVITNAIQTEKLKSLTWDVKYLKERIKK